MSNRPSTAWDPGDERLQGPPPEFGTWDEWDAEIARIRAVYPENGRYPYILRDPALAQWKRPRWYTRLLRRIFRYSPASRSRSRRRLF